MAKITQEQIENTAISVQKIGAACFCLLKVNSIQSKEVPKSPLPVYTIRLNGGIQIAATTNHAFRVARKGKTLFIPADSLQSEDAIWIDVGMWQADGSIHLQSKQCT